MVSVVLVFTYGCNGLQGTPCLNEGQHLVMWFEYKSIKRSLSVTNYLTVIKWLFIEVFLKHPPFFSVPHIKRKK